MRTPEYNARAQKKWRDIWRGTSVPSRQARRIAEALIERTEHQGTQ
jgi:hypothetical protein